jgi:glutaredoxin
MAHPPLTKTPPARLDLGWLACSLVLAACAPTVLAQGVFRVVGPDGKVTFTDRPPSAPTGPAAASAPAATSDTTTPSGTVPLALRQAMARFPVVLYTGTECNACDVGRKHLNTQGVPYTEKTVTTQADADALKQLSGAQTVPYLTIGRQGMKGYNEAEWLRYLAAAGYPAKSALPVGYKNPAPSPLAPLQASANTGEPAANGAPPANASTTTVAPVSPRGTNPAGIRF